MKNIMNQEERTQIQKDISEKYKKVAVSPKGNFNYPTGRDGLEKQSYDPEILKVLPGDVLAHYCGVGNPFSLGTISKGARILDVGCGAGVDTLFAAIMAGPDGNAVGIDLSPEMLGRARANATKAGLGNVMFQECSAELLPFSDASFDVVISNGVFNLVPDKPKALKEVYRVLSSKGRLLMADQVLSSATNTDTQSNVANWAG